MSYTLDGSPVNVTMSGGNLIATHANTSAGGVNSTSFEFGTVNQLQYYIEVTLLTSVSNGNSIGFMDPAVPVANPPNASTGSTNKMGALLGSSSSILYTQGNQNTGIDLGPAAVGDVFGMTLNLWNGTWWIRRNSGFWNGNSSANPATNTGGLQAFVRSPLAPYCSFANGGAATDAMKFNFGDSAYVGTPPAGVPPPTGGGGTDPTPGWTPFKLTTTVTPTLAGYIHVRVRAAKPSTIYYIDPKITLS